MEIVKENPTSFDPNKKYTWQANDEISISGQEFGLILNSVRAILGTEDAQRILLAAEADKAIQSVLARNVESGLIKEAQGGPGPNEPTN